MRLQLFDVNSAKEHTELVRQRRLCGWNEEEIPAWMDMIRSGERVFWWLFLEDSDTGGTRLRLEEIEEQHNFLRADGSNRELPPRDPSFTPVGHIALDHVLPDGELAVSATRQMKIATFFILLSQHSKGFGRLAMDRVEQTAKEDYGCQEILLDTIARWAVFDKAWRDANDLTDSRGQEGRSNAEWYERRGYKAYKEEWKYPWTKKDGTVIKLPAVYMRKTL